MLKGIEAFGSSIPAFDKDVVIDQHADEQCWLGKRHELPFLYERACAGGQSVAQLRFAEHRHFAVDELGSDGGQESIMSPVKRLLQIVPMFWRPLRCLDRPPEDRLACGRERT